MYRYEELVWFGSEYGLLERPCEWNIKLAGSITHAVSYYVVENNYSITKVAMDRERRKIINVHTRIKQITWMRVRQ